MHLRKIRHLQGFFNVGLCGIIASDDWTITMCWKIYPDFTKHTHTRTHPHTDPHTPPTHPPSHTHKHTNTHARTHARTHAHTHLIWWRIWIDPQLVFCLFFLEKGCRRDKIVSIKQNAEGCGWFKQNAGENRWQFSMWVKVKNVGVTRLMPSTWHICIPIHITLAVTLCVELQIKFKENVSIYLMSSVMRDC